MTDYWDTSFRNEGIRWGFEPADSALTALEIFKSYGLKKILIPGIGYGRNAKVFYNAGINITGIEISKSAIDLAAQSGLNFMIHHGSVTSMPFDNMLYDGIFCYALLHLLNKNERRKFLLDCRKQLKPGGIMVFTVVSKQADLYGNGQWISKDRFRLKNGITIFFYDTKTAEQEFKDFALLSIKVIDEPIKFIPNQVPLKCILIVCKKKPLVSIP
jgi:SAM-dependent methyltransferase